ncbi:transposase [Pelotomaculum propionicicum]|uniref:transposase n=1 Tax=Pelotomaculum propionicicum TaxID=258475 RepID=UPI003CFC791A
MKGKINHCVYNINYHIVFCPKYRHKVIKGYLRALPQTEYLPLFPGLKRNISGAAGYRAEVTTLALPETPAPRLFVYISKPRNRPGRR